MGVQSMCQEELDSLHRRHSVVDVEQAIEAIKRVGFPCVNLDIIYGIPGQTIQSLKNTSDCILSYDVEEVFVYPLYIKRDTWLCQNKVVQNAKTEELYRFVQEYLQRHGYQGLSMRRFVKRAGKMGSCGFENIISIGCGGRSYIGNIHFCTPYQVLQKDCRKQLAYYLRKQDYTQIENGFLLKEEEQRRRYSIKNLLFASGLDKAEYKMLFGGEFFAGFSMVSDWIKQGYVKEYANKLLLTCKACSIVVL